MDLREIEIDPEEIKIDLPEIKIDLLWIKIDLLWIKFDPQKIQFDRIGTAGASPTFCTRSREGNTIEPLTRSVLELSESSTECRIDNIDEVWQRRIACRGSVSGLKKRLRVSRSPVGASSCSFAASSCLGRSEQSFVHSEQLFGRSEQLFAHLEQLFGSSRAVVRSTASRHSMAKT